MGCHMHELAVEPKKGAVPRPAQGYGPLQDCLEYRLNICRRSTDHPQDLTRRSLLLQRLGEVLVAGLELLEQAHVLDGDDGLLGEGLEQRNLFVGEPTDHWAGHKDRSDRATLTPHGDDEQATLPGETCHSAYLRPLRALLLRVEHVNDGVVAKGSTGRQRSSNWRRIESCYHLGRRVLNTDQIDQIALEPEDRSENSVAQRHATAQDGVEDRLHVSRRAADDTQDLARRRLAIERGRHIAVAALQFLEQPYVLNRYHRLIGKGLEEGDLPI